MDFKRGLAMLGVGVGALVLGFFVWFEAGEKIYPSCVVGSVEASMTQCERYPAAPQKPFWPPS